MLELDQAIAHILAAIPPPATEPVPLDQACGRVPRERIISPIDLPPFDNSAMDGFAVHAADTASASESAPVPLRLAGRIAAGGIFHENLPPGACARLFTGSPLPSGANAVVMQENTRPDASQPDRIAVLQPVAPGENVRFRGEDLNRQGALAEAGVVLNPARLALIASAGVTSISAGQRAVVGLVATGSELKNPGEPLRPGQVYESNRTALRPLIERAGGVPRVFPVVPDALEPTRALLERAFRECDLVVTCGGVSVGELDLVKAAFEGLGGSLQFWRVAMKPGKPFAFGVLGRKLLFGLPGNPVSAFVTFLLLVRPALLRWQGAADVSLPSQFGVLTEALVNTGPRRHFIRVVADGAGAVRVCGTQASHRLAWLAEANGLVAVPAATTFLAGTQVQVLRWE